MKIKEFKSFIREEIISTLSEDVAYKVKGTSGETVQSFKSDQEAKDFDTKSANVTVKKLEEDELGKSQSYTLELDGREVDIHSIEIEDIHEDDYPDFSDAYIAYAEFSDDGTPLTEKEIEQLDSKYYGLVNELIFDNQLYLDESKSLDEMARAKVSYALNIDKAQELKDIIDKAKGNVKKALEYLLDKEVMSVSDVAKELGLNDTASINNPKFRELMNVLKEKGIVTMGGVPSAPAKEKVAKVNKEKAVNSVEKDIETGEEEADTYYKADDEDSTPEESDIDKQAAKAAGTVNKRTSKLDKVLKGLIQVEKEMKELANEYKTAEGEEKANIVAKLKEKTSQKKELEALKDKYEFDVV